MRPAAGTAPPTNHGRPQLRLLDYLYERAMGLHDYCFCLDRLIAYDACFSPDIRRALLNDTPRSLHSVLQRSSSISLPDTSSWIAITSIHHGAGSQSCLYNRLERWQ